MEAERQGEDTDRAKVPPQGSRDNAREHPDPVGAAAPDGASDDASDAEGASEGAFEGQVPGQGGTPLDELLSPEDGRLPASDADLTAAVRGGDDTAFEELYRRHAASVRRYARTCCRDSFTAEDLAGEVFARTLQALRAGKGPDIAVRAYLLTAVRNIAASWSRSDRREQLVDDFTAFAAASPAVASVDITDPGADDRAMAMADRSMVAQAFSRLDESDRMVLWHTAVEEEKPQQVALLLGKTANAAAVQAHRARDKLAGEFLQAHISAAQDSECEEYAKDLGKFARGLLRKRASAGLRAHLKDCDRCSAAYLELVELNSNLRVVLPGGVLLWVGAGYFTAAAAAGAGMAAAGAAGAGAAGAAGGGSSAGAGAAGGAASEGLGTPAKVGIATLVVAGGIAGLAFALAGSTPPKHVAAPPPAPRSVAPVPPPKPSPKPQAAPPPPPPAPAPKPTHHPSPPPPPAPRPKPKPRPKPPVPPPPPANYYADALPYGGLNPTGKQSGPAIDTWRSGAVWQRKGDVRIGGTTYQRGITVHAPNTTVIDLNRSCQSFDGMAGIDDMTMGLGAARFSVVDAGSRRVLWSSGAVRAGQRAVPVHAALAGVKSIELVVRPVGGAESYLVDVADWADARFSCRA